MAIIAMVKASGVKTAARSGAPVDYDQAQRAFVLGTVALALCGVNAFIGMLLVL
jgi:hypothetical protein